MWAAHPITQSKEVLRLESMAEATGITVSALLRVAAVEYLDNHGRRDSEGRVDVSDTPEKTTS